MIIWSLNYAFTAVKFFYVPCKLQRVLVIENVEQVTFLHSIRQLVQQVENATEDLDVLEKSKSFQ